MDDKAMEQARFENLELVLTSDATRKVIVAGPGTGKTYTFKRVLDQTDGAALVLSFLGNLVTDLERDLGERATVRTFHSYCRGLLHSMNVEGITRSVDYFPKFGQILDADLPLVRDGVIPHSIESSFMNLDDSTGIASSALNVGNYYNAVGHTDAVYRVHLALGQSPQLVPQFAQLLVDEYQDFSALEAALIAQLAAASPTLIVGDDDQALYGFKHASADYLRDLVNAGTFERFELPFCTRCTRVLVDATHRVVATATQLGLLGERIDKQYICYLPEKRAVSERYPKIRHARCSVERNNAPYICQYVAEQIGNIDAADISSSHDGGYPTVLIVAPTQFGKRIFEHLQADGFTNVEFRAGLSADIEILDGYRRLLKDVRSRLGWRIVLGEVQPPGWSDLVRRALLDDVDLADLLDESFRSHHLNAVELLRDVVNDERLDDDSRSRLQDATGLSLATIRTRLGLDAEPPVSIDTNAPRIVITSMLGAKGLQAEHVFVAGFNDHHFPQNNAAPTDDEVCQLLVALTRARQSCTLLSCGRFGNQQLGQSVFLQWLQPLLDVTIVNAAYWS